MNVRLRPELEALIKQDIERGAYQSVDEFVERAVSMLHEQEAWLAENRTAVAAKIEEGYAAAQRGDPIDLSEVRSMLDNKRRARRSK